MASSKAGGEEKLNVSVHSFTLESKSLKINNPLCRKDNEEREGGGGGERTYDYTSSTVPPSLTSDVSA